MARLYTAGEIVMSVEIPVAVHLNEPGAAAGATSQAAENGHHIPTSMLPGGADKTLAGFSGLAIERIPGGIAIGVEGLICRLIISPTGTTNQVSQDTLAVRGDDGHTKIMM